MNEDRFWELVSLKLSGEAQQGELEELETLLKESPDQGLRLDMLNTIWKSGYESQSLQKKKAFNRHMQRLSNHLSDPVLQYENPEPPAEVLSEQPVVRSGKYRKLLWAGGIAASLLIGVFVFPRITGHKEIKKAAHSNSISTKRGSKSKVQLPDGTQVWLNSDSRITYSENFHDCYREVQLTGEAFFDVVHDEKRPFIIHAAAIDVKVLGTAFNVRSYADEKNTETSLIRGSVEITLVNSADKKKIILKPNDKLIVSNGQAELKKEEEVKTAIPVMTLAKIKYKEKDSSALETSWIDNLLVFDADPMEDVAQRIERWYDIKVTITDEKLKKKRFTATFEGQDLQTVVEAFRLSGFKCSLNKREMVLRP